MGTHGRKIVKDLNIDEVIEQLNKALADEWLAYYQYWTGAKVVEGPMSGALIGELEEHAADELRHAGMLVERIIQLGGKPLLKPSDWDEKTNCGYEVPEDFFVKAILKQNIKGEQCAIDIYQKIAEMTFGKDVLTYNMVVEILEDEVEHEEDLEVMLDDFNMMKKL